MKEKIYFSNLDSLRTIACLIVFSEHVFWNSVKTIDTNSNVLSHILYVIFGNGLMGVSFFFTLSGFLITYLILKEIENSGRLNVKAFYVRRTLRIWPLFLVLIMFVFFIFPAIQQMAGIEMTNPANKIYYFTFLSNFDVIRLANEGKMSFLQSGITWSISIEEQFYIIWPLLFLFVPKKRFLFIFLGVILVSLIFRVMNFPDEIVLYFHTLGVCADLAVGGLFAYLVLNNNSFRTFFTNMNSKYRIGLYIVGFLYILFNEYLLNFEYALAFRRIISSFFFAFIIVQQSFDTKSWIKMGKFRFLNWAGKYTYGMYLLHPIGVLVFELFRSYFNWEISGLGMGFIKSMAVLIVTIVISYLSFHMLEKPFLKLKERFSVV